MASPFLVPVAQLLRAIPSSTELAFHAPFDEAHEFEPRASVETDVPIDSEVEVAIRIDSFRGGVRARGTVVAPWRGICRRCSVVVDGTLAAAVNERYVDDPAPEDEEAYPFEGEFINLLPLVHDAVLLELPIAPLCRPDCRGLCPTCGIELNEEQCDCRPEVDSRWATLDALRFEDPASD